MGKKSPLKIKDADTGEEKKGGAVPPKKGNMPHALTFSKSAQTLTKPSLGGGNFGAANSSGVSIATGMTSAQVDIHGNPITFAGGDAMVLPWNRAKKDGTLRYARPLRRPAIPLNPSIYREDEVEGSRALEFARKRKQARKTKEEIEISITNQIRKNRGTTRKITADVHFVDSNRFNFAVGAIVLVDISLIGAEYDCNYVHPTRGSECSFSPAIFSILQYVTTCVYSFEAAARIAVHGKKYFKSTMNLLDFALAGLALFETFVLPEDSPLGTLNILKVLRVVKILRIVRLLRLFKELMLLLIVIGESLRSLFWVFMLISAITYAMAIFIVLWLHDVERTPCENDPEYLCTRTFDEDLTKWTPHIIEEYFPKVYSAYFTLCQIFMGRGSKAFKHIVFPIAYEMPHVGLALLFFIMIVRFGILNIILGVIVNTTLKAEKSRDQGISKKVQEEQAKVLNKLKDFFIACDLDGNGELDKSELTTAFEQPAVSRLFQQLDVPITDPAELFDLLDLDRSGGITFDEFLDGIIRLKSSIGHKDVANLFAMMDGNEDSGRSFVRRAYILKQDGQKMQAVMSKCVAKLEEIAYYGEDPVLKLRRKGDAKFEDEAKVAQGARLESVEPFGPLVAVVEEAPVELF
jgi:Ca2+-binding EF-hand superfamily protein